MISMKRLVFAGVAMLAAGCNGILGNDPHGLAVTPVVTKKGITLTIEYVPPALLESGSTHTVSVGYLDAGGLPATAEWSFAVIAQNCHAAGSYAAGGQHLPVQHRRRRRF